MKKENKDNAKGEVILLLLAIIFPFGLVAYAIYKYLEYAKKKEN